MKNKRLTGAFLAIAGGSLGFMVLPSQGNILELPMPGLIVIFSVLMCIIGTAIVIRTDRKNRNYYVVILVMGLLLLLAQFI